MSTVKESTPAGEGDGLRLMERAPTLAEYSLLRQEVGWAEVEDEGSVRGLGSALYSVCLETRAGDLVGCARVVGDGGIYFYVQDVMVREAWRGRGLGARLMDAVMSFLDDVCVENSFVGLMAAQDVATFYHRYGFRERPPERPGMFRMWRR